VLEQQKNETAYRQLLAQGALAVLLPTEDLENGCLRTLVSEVFGELILGSGIGGKACEGWLLWEGIAKTLEDLQARISKKALDDEQRDTRSQLERYGLLSSKEDTDKASTGRRPSPIADMLWNILQYAFLAFTALRILIVALATSPSLPRRAAMVNLQAQPPIASGDQAPKVGPSASGRARPLAKQPILSMQIWPCFSHLLDLDVRMPWLAGLLSLLQWGALAGPGRVGDTNGALDR